MDTCRTILGRDLQGAWLKTDRRAKMLEAEQILLENRIHQE
jgi:hypothetical protein